MVQRLVAGPGVYIYNECIELSATIVAVAAQTAAERGVFRRRSQYYNRSAEDILATLPVLAAIVGAVGMTVDAGCQRFEAILFRLRTPEVRCAVGYGPAALRKHLLNEPRPGATIAAAVWLDSPLGGGRTIDVSGFPAR